MPHVGQDLDSCRILSIMTTATPEPRRSLGNWLREIHDGRLTGKLEVALDGETRELYFLAGELYLAPSHPAYEAAKAWAQETRSSASESQERAQGQPSGGGEEGSAPPFRQLTGPIISVSGGGEPLEGSFVAGAGQIRLDLVGPLPTHQLVMECSVWAIDEAGLWRQLGGEETVLRASVGLEETMASIQIEPQEAFLLSRLDPPARVGELVSQLDLGHEQVLRSLCRLQAVGLVEKLVDDDSAPDLSQPKEKLVSRFEESVAASLENEPLEIEAEAHRELLGSLLSRMGEMTYFEMLAVSAHSSDEEIHKAYLELGRLVHPSHAQRLGLGGKEGAFRVLFERATDAYLTLNDPSRKMQYVAEIGPAAQVVDDGPSGEIRDQEKQNMARNHYERALTLADRHDFHSAIQLMEQAVKVDPRIEYLTLLGDCQAENPQWLERAAQSYGQALKVRPGDPTLYSRLGRVYERLGNKERAMHAYEEALAVAPEFESARAGLWRLGGGHPPEAEKSTLVDRLRKILRV